MLQILSRSVLILILSFGLSAQEKKVPDKALCTVCALRGETEPEKVKAHLDYEGDTYYFCSSNCRKEFDADPEAYLPPILPRPAPAFVVETLDGKDVALQDLKGNVVLLDFWASWCKPCFEMMPKLQQLHDASADKGLVVMGVSIDEGKDRIKKAKKVVDKLNISYPIFSDAKNSPAWHLFKVKAIPAMFLIDRSGQIVAQWTGKIDHEQVVREVNSRIVSPVDNN